MCLLQSKAPPISKIDPTLLFLPAFKMYRHDISTVLTEALSPQSQPFLSLRLGDNVNIVIVHTRRKIFALDYTICSYEDEEL